MNRLLTFEISDDKTEIEIHGNEEGLEYLIEVIKKVIKFKTHDHLMTASWAGNELCEEPQGVGTEVINKVTIGIHDK